MIERLLLQARDEAPAASRGARLGAQAAGRPGG